MSRVFCLSILLLYLGYAIGIPCAYTPVCFWDLAGWSRWQLAQIRPQRPFSSFLPDMSPSDLQSAQTIILFFLASSNP